MKMEAYQLRVVEEKTALDEKRSKLVDFLMSDKFKELDKHSQALLSLQADAMNTYSAILSYRILSFQS